ncbi:MAG: outer membrane lipoprotein-sorting protein [Vicinamibacteria bacterium]|nr:outer membrane lipoprotein-sorting protein [Vicinamibacteria bacterium]
MLAFAAAIAPTIRAQAPKPGSADWVARQIQDRDTGRDSRFDMQMRMFDKQGRMRERHLRLAGLRGAEKGERADRLLIRFLFPNDIKGTGFLVLEHPGADDERFLYLPALGRVRRIAGEEKQDSFVGSDFTYEDIGGRELTDYAYAIVEAAAPWTDPGGKAWPAWRLESRAKDPTATYPRVVSTVLKDTFVVVAADNFNRRDEVVKTFEVRKLQQISGIWTALELVMQNRRDRTRTEMSVTRAEYNVGLKETDFTRRTLEQDAR